jgi:hypothetical protein
MCIGEGGFKQSAAPPWLADRLALGAQAHHAWQAESRCGALAGAAPDETRSAAKATTCLCQTSPRGQ